MTNAVTLASLANSGYLRNRIINGAMQIDQRNAGASGTAVGYTVDRWTFAANLSTKGTWQQNAGGVTPPTGFKNYLGFTSNSAYSVLAADYFAFVQPIEGLNVSDLNWGTASASAVTLSFWVRSSLTGVFGGTLKNSGATRSYPFTYTILSANTWEYKTVTIPGDTSGTWLTTNGLGIEVILAIGVGSTYSGTAGSWAGANYVSATGATSVVGTNGATFYITGVQLEVGTQATPFEWRPYGIELELCMRYFEILGRAFGSVRDASAIWCNYNYAVPKRASATLALLSSTPYGESPPSITARANSGATITTHSSTTSTGSFWVTGYNSLTTYQPAFVEGGNISSSAEL